MTHHVTLLPGDGVGPEVSEAARRVLDATGVPIDWEYQKAGALAPERLSREAVAAIRRNGVALKGPTATPVGAGFRSVNLELRRQLDLYAGIRPCRAYEGVPTPFPRADLVVVRMNHEDLYAGLELGHGDAAAGELRELLRSSIGARLTDDTGVSIKPISASGARRVSRSAFEYARKNGRERVTAVHKASVMRATDGLFLEAATEVAADYPDIAFDDVLVDTACARLVSRPQQYDVLLLPTLYGDIVSDIAAALTGGVGMAPGVNLGDDCAVFEAVHGSAPRRAGQGVANPLGLMLSGVLMLRHLGERSAAARLEDAIATVVREGKTITYDLARSAPGRAAGTAEVADAVIARLEST